MITFNKINDLYAEVILDDIKIGHVERLNKQTLALEISYQRIVLSYSKRKLIGELARKIYRRLEANKNKPRIGASILQTGFKTLD